MREIIFRGKRVDNDKWVEGKLPEPFGNLWVLIDTDTIGQYTNVLDKNGVKVFEGDVVRFDVIEFQGNDGDYKTYEGVVIFENGAFGFKEKTLGAIAIIFECSSIEIIGNIHDKEATHEQR